MYVGCQEGGCAAFKPPMFVLVNNLSIHSAASVTGRFKINVTVAAARVSVLLLLLLLCLYIICHNNK